MAAAQREREKEGREGGYVKAGGKSKQRERERERGFVEAAAGQEDDEEREGRLAPLLRAGLCWSLSLSLSLSCGQCVPS